MIYESTRKMSVKEQEAYDLGYLNGKEAALRSPWVKTSDRLPDPSPIGCPCRNCRRWSDENASVQRFIGGAHTD